MTSGWYYAKAGTSAGREIGPLTWEQLFMLAHGGTLAPADVVWNPKLPRGVTAGQIPGLFPTPEAPLTRPVPVVAQPAPLPATPPVIPPQPVAQPVAPPTIPPVAAPAVTPAVPPTIPPVVAPAVMQVTPSVVPQQPAPTPVSAPVAQPPASRPVETLWEIGPAVVRVTPPATTPQTEAQPEAPDLFTREADQEAAREETAREASPKEPRPPRVERQSRNLPWLIVLLILVTAVAGVAAYFLYFRDAGGTDTGSTATTAAAPSDTTIPMARAAIWTKLFTPGDMPAARSHHAMVYDPTTDRTILFGGSNRNGKFDDTWAFDLASKSWTKLATSSGPSARDRSQMVYNSAAGDIILFGGSDASEDRNDLWAFDAKSKAWTELKPAGVLPQARQGHSMVYEPNTGRVLVFGGLSDDTGELLNDLWAYDLATNAWTLLTPPGSLPAGRQLASMSYFPASQLVLLFGGLSLGTSADSDLGDMWAYNAMANTWTQIGPLGTAPISRQGQAMVAAPALGGLLMFGGLHGETDLDETWLFEPLTNTWSRLQRPARAAPGARNGHALAYDSASGSVDPLRRVRPGNQTRTGRHLGLRALC